VPHHFIASHSVQEEVTAVTFEQFALRKVQELFEEKEVVVVTGGTGLYIQAFSQGLDEIPAIDPAIRQRIAREYGEKGLAWLQAAVKQKDPAFFEKGETQNPQRMMRALEVIEGTGESVLFYRTGQKQQRNFEIVRIGLQLPKEELHHNIHTRVEKMVQVGLVEEVKSLLPYRELNALRTVGYSEIFDFLDNKITLKQAMEDIKTNTRRYAKRQMTWFRRDSAIKWFLPAKVDDIYAAASE
jgi:tRNA dimethylallyltransferase